jgi:hypothetical protein
LYVGALFGASLFKFGFEKNNEYMGFDLLNRFSPPARLFNAEKGLSD